MTHLPLCVGEFLPLAFRWGSTHTERNHVQYVAANIFQLSYKCLLSLSRTKHLKVLQDALSSPHPMSVTVNPLLTHPFLSLIVAARSVRGWIFRSLSLSLPHMTPFLHTRKRRKKPRKRFSFHMVSFRAMSELIGLSCSKREGIIPDCDALGDKGIRDPTPIEKVTL